MNLLWALTKPAMKCPYQATDGLVSEAEDDQ
jgi:hypothetical protein